MSVDPIARGLAATALAPLPSQRIGQVATGCYNNDTLNGGGNKSFMSRNSHFARDKITSLKMVIGNFKGAEVAIGGSGTYTASIEYPAGTFTQVTWGGATSVPGAGAASLITSDWIGVNIPRGAQFWTRIWGNFTASWPFFGQSSQTLGEGFEYGTSAVTDKTLIGTVTYNAGLSFKPAALIANTRVPSVALMGDSRVQGFGDSPDATGDYGCVARSVGPVLPYLSVGVGGDRADSYVSTHTLREQLVAYCTHRVCDYGINDLQAGVTGATCTTSLASIAALKTTPIWFCTVSPITTSTDSWATPVAPYTGTNNQSKAAWEAQRLTLNKNIRTGISGSAGHFEIADQNEIYRDSGYWKATSYTTDGGHESQFALRQIQASGAVNPDVFWR